MPILVTRRVFIEDASAIVSDPTARFFDDYLKCLIKPSIPEKQRRWYVKRLEDFIKAKNGHKIKTLPALNIKNYLEMIGRQNHLTGWQFHQCIDAIRILYCDLLQTPQCQDVDWHYWFDSAKRLGIDHPTTARQFTPQQLTFIKERKGNGALNQVLNDHHTLLARFTQAIRRRSYAYRTEQSYEQWVGRFILFCKNQPPSQVGAREVKRFLDHLAILRRVSASTQNQALNALIFLYKQVLEHDLGELGAFARAKRPQNLPVVLSRSKATALLSHLTGIHKLVLSLLYGTGMRRLEGLRLRVQDLDFAYGRIHIHQA
jgi:hypothetical protein